MIHTVAGAPKGKRRRRSSVSTISTAAGMANHGVERGASGAPVLSPTSSAIPTAPATIRASNAYLRASDLTR